MFTPHDIRQYIEQLNARPQEPSEEERKLCEFLLTLLPRQPDNGKICPACERKCFCACRVCPHCNYRLKPKLRRAPAIPVQIEPPEPVPRAANDCTKCAKPMSDQEKFILECGCAYHKECLRKKAKAIIPHHRKCFCKKPGCHIPIQFFS